MPLVAAGLEADIKAAFDAQGEPADTAQAIADAYEKYAKGGLAGAAPPTLTGSEKTLYAKTIESAISNPDAGNPVLFATALANGLVTFWSAPPVIFSAGPILGMATPPAGAAAAISVISAGLAPGNTPDVAAKTIATALDAATKTTIVVFTAPPPPAGPPPPAPIA
jgi:hypothetical protein